MPYSNHPLAPELPFLRRYARAATGQRDAGDAIIADAMHALAKATIDTNSPHPRRVRQFRTLVSAIDAAQPTVPGGEAGISKNIATLPPTMRHALLLTALEDFHTNDAALILDVRPEEIPTLVSSAQIILRQVTRKKILIIEDDDLMAASITEIVEGLGHVVCAHARTEREALVAAATLSPALILADIHLGPGGSGLQAVQQILATTTVPVVFVTGYPELVLTGKGIEPAFVLRKPYRAEALRTAIGQALVTNGKSENR